MNSNVFSEMKRIVSAKTFTLAYRQIKPYTPFTPEEVPATSMKFRKYCLGRSANFVVFEKCEIVPCLLRPHHALAKLMLRWWCSH